MSENLDPKDKIILDCTDSKEITDHFSRLSPGDEVKGDFTATLDESGEKIVTLSIKEITIADASSVTIKKGEGGGEDDKDEDEPAGLMVSKDENGTPSQVGSDEVPEPLMR